MATTPTQIPSAEIKIRVPRLLLASLNEMCRLALMPLEPFISQMIEVQIAEFRRRKIPADFLTPKFDPRGVAQGLDIHRRKFNVELRDKVVQRLDNGQPVAEVAAATGLSKSTIRRIREEQ